MKIEFTDVEKIYNLRRDVMRPGMDLSYVMYDEDNNEGSFHLAAVEDDKIVACITFFSKHQCRFALRKSVPNACALH